MFSRVVSRSMLIVVLALLLPTVLLSAQSASQTIDLVWDTFLAEGFPEQDVFIMSDEDSMLHRITPEDSLTVLDAPIYSLADESQFVFDPFQLYETPLGPFEAGEPLGMSMLAWLAASGSGTYTVEGDMATVDLTFRGLVPDGLYTLWCSELHVPPEFEVINKPCGAEDGSENVFNTDAHGEAAISLSFPVLPGPTEETVPVLAIAWHADGQTYGADPGPFGANTFTQLHSLVIPPAE